MARQMGYPGAPPAAGGVRDVPIKIHFRLPVYWTFVSQCSCLADRAAQVTGMGRAGIGEAQQTRARGSGDLFNHGRPTTMERSPATGTGISEKRGRKAKERLDGVHDPTYAMLDRNGRSQFNITSRIAGQLLCGHIPSSNPAGNLSSCRC